MIRTTVSSCVIAMFMACFLSLSSGFSTTTTTTPTQCNQKDTALSATSSNYNEPMSRRTSLFWTAAAITSSAIPLPANAAKQVDPALKGTKKDPSYEACVSQCMYDCTKPKGSEQKSRQECLPECKKQCATTKEQLMTGTPISKE